jgi:hypothetical protein
MSEQGVTQIAQTNGQELPILPPTEAPEEPSA